MSGPRTLAFDIETAPTLAYTFSLFKTNIGHNQIVEHPRIICFSARWLGTKKVIFKSEHHDGRDDMLTTLYELIDEADILLTYNGKKFDYPWALGEFMAEGWTPPSPVKHIDMYLELRRQNRFPSNKLDYVSKRLLENSKITHSGFSLWMDCLNGDDKAWRLMKRYAIHDTNLLVDLYETTKGWVKMPHPVSNTEGSCINCGSTHLNSRGRALTLNGSYQRYVCIDCGKWQRGTARDTVGTTRNIA